MSKPPVTVSVIVGSRVRGVMAERGVTQQQLAAALGFDAQTAVSKRLRGVTPWSIDELVATAAYLDVALERIAPADELRAAVA